MRRRSMASWLVGLCALFALGVAQAQTVLYTTLPAAPNGGPCFGAGNLAAVELATPAGAPYQIGSATVRMHHYQDATASFTVGVYTDNAGVPGTLVGSLGTYAGNGLGTQDLYTLTPAAPIALAASTNYWVVASSASANGCAFGWTQSGSAPSGVFTYVTERQYFGGAWNDRAGADLALELRGATIAPPVGIAPVPTTSEWVLGLMATLMLFAAVRRLRR